MKKVNCPHCEHRFRPGIVMCSNPFQVHCPKCRKIFFLDTHGHSGVEPTDIPGYGGHKLDKVFEEVGPCILNTKGLNEKGKVQFLK